jgi:hypothetical protein
MNESNPQKDYFSPKTEWVAWNFKTFSNLPPEDYYPLPEPVEMSHEDLEEAENISSDILALFDGQKLGVAYESMRLACEYLEQIAKQQDIERDL